MSSHINKNQENQDVVSSGAFRSVFFGDSTKRTTSNPHEEAVIKRARLDSTISLQQGASPVDAAMTSAMSQALEMDAVMPAADPQAAADDEVSRSPAADTEFQHTQHSQFVSTPTCATPVNVDSQPPHAELASSEAPMDATAALPMKPKHSLRKQTLNRVKKHRSRSLPNILFSYTRISTATAVAVEKTLPPPLPPVNIQSLREIDLTEILKNPQLRHDILFDPQLQFRPNLDGERGRRKKITYDKYWSGVRLEIESYYIHNVPFNKETSRLPNLFSTLKEILLSLLPSKHMDRDSVTDIMDIDLIMQQITQKALDFVGLASWLSNIFKSHCAPMRDLWVDEMITLFQDASAESESSVHKIVEGLRLVFSVLEAMKLDVANHQIRSLRPVLVQTAVAFEKDYFTQMISRCKLDISDSLTWFSRYHQSLPSSESTPRDAIVPAILSLLSCSNMVSEFPSSLAFDHARLIVLRANVRQVVCFQLCLALYRQLVCQCTTNSPVERASLISENNLNLLKKEVSAIITDDNGNVKWTRNIGAIALQLIRRSSVNEIEPRDARIDFAFNWLIKQTQPSSPVYALMEQQVFKSISEKVAEEGDELCTTTGTIITSGKKSDDDDAAGIASRIALLTKFHWSVFGSHYTKTVA